MTDTLFIQIRERVALSVRSSALVCITLFLCGCSPQATSETEGPPTLAHVMDPLLNDASEVFWDSAGFIDTYEGTTDLTPTTEEGWQKVIDAADEITRLSAVLQDERYSLNRPAWNELSQMLVIAADRGRQSVIDRDSAELFEAGAQLYQVCVACHQTFWSNNRFTISESESQ